MEIEPENHLPYSNTYRPDLVGRRLARGGGGRHIVGDVKFLDPLSSNFSDIDRRGAFVAFGSTKPGIHAKVFGLAQRGEKGDGNFNPATGGGYVARTEADYSPALSQGHEVACLLFETFGGFSPAVVRLLKRAADAVNNRRSRRCSMSKRPVGARGAGCRCRVSASPSRCTPPRRGRSPPSWATAPRAAPPRSATTSLLPEGRWRREDLIVLVQYHHTHACVSGVRGS